ncbi:MAG TPA: VOC family protein [Acidimicrobiia bacterium]|jgi:catechol 2,3-dioxygenase-like lactoylglutathione lyase family enzyme
MAITGMHALIYTSKPDETRAVLRDAFGFDFVEAHPGWLIFALPPSELGVHPIEGDGAPFHQLSFMCDDLDATMAELRDRGVEIRGEPENQGFGVVVTMVLPGDVEVMLYEPRHPTAI